MNNPIPYYLFDIKEKKLIFYNTYLPEYINQFKSYINELQLCLDYNYIINLNNDNKTTKLIDFFTQIFSTFKCDINNVAGNKVITAGQKKLNLDFIKFWIDKFNTLSNKIKQAILDKTLIKNTASVKVNINQISNSIGHLTHLQNILDNNTSPYYDYGNEYTQLNIPIGSAVFNKISKNMIKSITTAEYKTNIILKHNIKAVQNSKVELLEAPLLKTGYGYATTAHGDNLVTDIKVNYFLYSIVDELNGILITNISQIIYQLVKLYSFTNNTIKKTKINMYEFTSIDNEGQNLKIDIYGNILS